MNLKNKLKGLPTIYYFNLDHRNDRREYMESQFDYWGIKDYHRISSSKYLSTEIDTWVHKLIGYNESILYDDYVIATAITHLEIIKNWLETTKDEYMIMMEDDYDLSLIEYWNFDWEYLMNHIPYDWDCIQLGFESRKIIKFFLHPKLSEGTYFGPCLINRDYAKKLIKLHCVDDRFRLNMKTNHFFYKKEGSTLTIDYFICENGRTYCIPLITCNWEFNERNINERFFHKNSRDLYYNWWQNEHYKFSLEDFFTYGKPNDYMMTRKVNHQKAYTYS